MDNLILKKIYSRRLRSGEYVIVAHESSPLVIDEETIKPLLQGDISQLKQEEDVINVFKEANFFSEIVDNKNIPEEKKTKKSKTMIFFLFLVGTVSLICIITSIFIIGVPTGNKILPSDISMLTFLIFIIFFYPIVALLHELMHMIFARTLDLEFGGLGLDLSKGVAFVSMNHIWAWSFWPRIAALSAGIVSDLTLLAFFSLMQIFYDSWILTTASAILWSQIIWQFQFHRNCDGHLIALMAIDDPFIHINAFNQDVEKTKYTSIWKLLSVLGYIVSAILILFWIIPFVINFLYALIS
jgi:hypothetical protein